MGSIGSMTKPPEGFLAALIQYPVPVVESRKDIEKQIEQIVRTVHSTKARYPGLELIVFPEYSTQGLNTKKWTTDEFLCTIPGPETDAFAQACKEAQVYGVFSIMEKNPDGGLPYNTAIIIDPQGEIILKYRKLNPWVPIEPWQPGDLGMPVCDGPGGSKLAVCICHDGMFPEIARETAYKGANVLIRISGYSTQVSEQWILTNRSNVSLKIVLFTWFQLHFFLYGQIMLGNHLLVPQFSINQSIRYSIKMFVLYVHTHCNGSIFES